MRIWLIALALATIAMTTVVGVGCGGGGGEMSRAELEALIREMAVTIDDLPSGLNLQEETFADNEEAAESDPEGPSAARARFKREGRLLGYFASYLTADPLGAFTSGGIGLIVVLMSVHEDAEGASAAMDFWRGQLANPTVGTGFLQNVTELEAEPLSFPSVGDETEGYKYKGTFQPEDIQIDVGFTAHTVVIRRDRVIAGVIVAAIGGATPGQEVEDIIRTMNDRIGQAL